MAADEFDISKFTDYEYVKKLGSGSYGKVVLVKKKETGQEYAMKIFEINNDWDRDIDIGNDTAIREVNITTICDHPYVVRLHDSVIGDDYMYAVLDLADSDLFGYLEKFRLTNYEKTNIIYKLALALQHIHSCQYIHCDLKSVNVLMKGNTPLIADFGIVKSVEDYSSTLCQTFNYRAPETDLFLEEIEQRYGLKVMERFMYKPNLRKSWSDNPMLSEMWSFGILCLDVLFNKGDSTYDTAIFKGKLVDERRKRRYTRDPYLLFLGIIFEWHNTPENFLRKGKPIEYYRLIEETLNTGGTPLDEDDRRLLKLVCRLFLPLDQNKRINALEKFINSEYFVEKGFSGEDYHTYQSYHVDKMYLYQGDDERMVNNVKILIGWLKDVCEVLKIYPNVMMNATDYVIQKIHVEDFNISKRNLQDFGAAVLWIMNKIYLIGELSTYKLADYSEQDNDTKIREMIFRILKYEKCVMKFESLYNQLHTKELMLKGMKVMLDPAKYIKYCSPRNLAIELIRESSDIIESKTRKDFTDFEGIY